MKCSRPWGLTRRALSVSCRVSARASLDLDGRPFRLAVVGAGPAGFYAASKFLSLPGTQNVRVDMFEELPTPFGLVRYGVAPDHPEVKNCQHKFEQTAEDPRFRFFGNVQVGGVTDASMPTSDATFTPPSPNFQAAPSRYAAHLPLDYLRVHYNAVLLAYGASFDRPLRISGEMELANIYSAREFVHFYNGHPYAHLPNLDLSKIEHVTIVGQGNVAFDCARMLLTSVDKLATTDVPEPVLAELARSRVKRVDVVGRRGPLQVAGTTKELRELLTLPGVSFDIDQSLLRQAETDLNALTTERAKKRLIALMREGAKSPGDKEWSLKFLLSPIAFATDSSSSAAAATYLSFAPVRAVKWAVNELVGQDPLNAQCKPTQQSLVTQTDLVLKSVGYRSIGIHGVPFDEQAGVVSNAHGRVVNEYGQVVPDLYAAGWLSRGPTGVIATTMFDAYLIAEMIAADALSHKGRKVLADPDIEVSLGPNSRPVSWTDWKRIDAQERRRGTQKGRLREKITSIPEMLALLAAK